MAMRVGKLTKIGLQAVLITSLCGTTSIASAQFLEPVQRAGRICGVGWGDGYHACRHSGLRLLADLPPRSYASRYGDRHHPKQWLVHHPGATFYDRFDAANGRCCSDRCCGDGAACDAGPCDAGPGCESYPISALEPSNAAGVEQPESSDQPNRPQLASQPTTTDTTRQADLSATPIARSAAPRHQLSRPATATDAHLSDLDSRTLSNMVSEPINRKYAIGQPRAAGNAAAFVTPGSSSNRQAMEDVSMGFGLSPASPIDPVTRQPMRPAFVSSRTPGLILPTHPDPPVNSDPPAVAVKQETGGASGISSPLVAQGVEKGKAGPMPPPEPPMVATPSLSMPPVSNVPSYAVETFAQDDVAEVTSSAPRRPQRLGGRTVEIATQQVQPKLPTFLQYPRRLGAAGSARANPVANTLKLETSERGVRSEEQIVRQPSGTELKRR